jgi:hypothetical protein
VSIAGAATCECRGFGLTVLAAFPFQQESVQIEFCELLCLEKSLDKPSLVPRVLNGSYLNKTHMSFYQKRLAVAIDWQ